MQSFDFGKVKYLITQYCYDYQFPHCSSVICIGCDSEQQVFEYFNEQIEYTLENYFEDDLQNLAEDIEDFDIILDMINSKQTITNLGMITGILDILCEGSACAYRVTDDKGNIWFSYKC